eukprot:scaffold163_cov69-Phaeocystis_antarctica.AAC.1
MHSFTRRECSSSVWLSSVSSSPSSSSSRSSWSAAPRARRATSSLSSAASARCAATSPPRTTRLRPPKAGPHAASLRRPEEIWRSNGQLNDWAHGACGSNTGRLHVSAHASAESRRHWPRPQRGLPSLSCTGVGVI